MELTMKDTNSALTVKETTFGREFNEALIHQVVVAYANGGRQGSVKQKNRPEVSGGGKKPRRQKGTGHARAGSIRSPLWRHGAVTFAARPQDYSEKVNRKMYSTAIKSILSELVRQNRLVVVNEFSVDTPKTKALLEKLKSLDLQNVFIVDQEVTENLYLASRNLGKSVRVSDVLAMDPVSLIRHDKVLMTSGAVRKVEELWG